MTVVQDNLNALFLAGGALWVLAAVLGCFLLPGRLEGVDEERCMQKKRTEPMGEYLDCSTDTADE